MKRKFIAAMVIGFLVLGVQMSFVVDSFPGFHSSGDCTECHNNPANAYNFAMAEVGIVVDGIADDDQWQNHEYRRTYVPVAGRFGNPHMFVQVTFAQNDTHIMILANWEDPTIHGTDTAKYENADGIAFMFNINETTFTSGYGMKGPREAPDLAVDLFTWKPAASATGDENVNADAPFPVAGNVYDWVYTNDTDFQGPSEWTVAAVHGNVSDHNEENYQVEFVRPLTTDDPNDVQFDTNKYYQFAVAIFNNTAGSSHYVSPPQSVWVQNPADTVNTYPQAPGPVTEYTQYITETEKETVVKTELVNNTETSTSVVVQTETTGKEPLAFLPVVIGMFAVPVIVLLRKK